MCSKMCSKICVTFLVIHIWMCALDASQSLNQSSALHTAILSLYK